MLVLFSPFVGVQLRTMSHMVIVLQLFGLGMLASLGCFLILWAVVVVLLRFRANI